MNSACQWLGSFAEVKQKDGQQSASMQVPCTVHKELDVSVDHHDDFK